MPVVAIVAAGAAWMGAAGAIGAGITAAGMGAGIMGTLGAIGLTGALTITAAVGATLGAIGQITHDKGLTMAGTIIGGIGAVGAIANTAGMFGDTSQLFGVHVNVGDLPAPPSDFIESLNKSVTSVATDPIEVSSLGQVTNQAVGDVVNTVPGAATVEAPPSAAAAAEAATAPSVAAPPLDTAAQEVRLAALDNTDTTNLMSVAGAKTTPLGEPISGATAFQAPATPQPEALARVANLEKAQAAATSTIEAPPVGEKPSFFDKFLNFADKHDMATYGMIQAASQLVGGMLDPTTQPKIAAMDAQAQVNRATAAEQERQTANASGAIPAAHLRPRTLAPVTGSPSVTPQAVTGKPYVYPGLINSSAVTGAPA